MAVKNIKTMAENEFISLVSLMCSICLSEARVALQKWSELSTIAGTFDEKRFQRISLILDFFSSAPRR